MIVRKLHKILMEYGIENILSYLPRTKAIRRDMVECDYFDLLSENPQAIQHYTGKYLEQYTWAEKRKGHLDRIKLKTDPLAENILYEED